MIPPTQYPRRFCTHHILIRVHSTELDALGDDFLADSEDTSYLDAVSAPDPPTGVPQDTGKSKTQGGVKLDEFGLPELPN